MILNNELNCAVSVYSKACVIGFYMRVSVLILMIMASGV